MSFAVAANALTASLKDKAGSNPSVGSPVKVGFRSSTAATGTYIQRSVTGALATTISSGSTAGFVNGQSQYLYWYLIDNAGTVELAWSGVVFDEGSLVSTTAEGGAGAADSIATMYSTTARSNVPCRLIARTLHSLTTAGTWNEVPDEVSLKTLEMPNQVIAARYSRTTTQSISDNATTRIDFATKVYDTHNAVTTGASWVFTCPSAGYYSVSCSATYNSGGGWASGERVELLLVKNAALDSYLAFDVQTSTHTNAVSVAGAADLFLALGDTIDIRTLQNSGASLNITNDGTLCYVCIRKIG